MQLLRLQVIINLPCINELVKMTALQGCCSFSTRGSRANDFEVIISPAPASARRTTPKQTAHYSHYKTKLANSLYFHGISRRIPLTEPPPRPSCSWKSSEYCHPLYILINAIARIVLNEGHNITCWIWRMTNVPPNVQSTRWLMFDPKLAAVCDLNPVWSSTSLYGTPNLATQSNGVTML